MVSHPLRRRSIFTKGQFFDELIYGLTKEEFETMYVTKTHMEGESNGRKN
jgi:hypothetical protein